ncbi:MAG: type II toxin-antitoxin system RelE/ParE family toxin [Porphyrobacter sp.]|nr:type II toxin-antitoxin system RelE/ParE family toxin [Porphyrobacter sp.]
MNSLLQFSLRYPEIEPRPGLRRMNSGKYAVIYRVHGNRVEIIRVLHVASDLGRFI